MATTNTNTTARTTCVRPGLHQGTLTTVEGHTFTVHLERADIYNSASYDRGWWSCTTTDHLGRVEQGAYDHRTLADAWATMRTATWYMHPRWGLCVAAAAAYRTPDDACQAGTVGCSVDHTPAEEACQPW